MRIGVNARLLQEKYYTGIQNYIESLYKEIKRIDKKNQYIFLDNQFGNGIISNVLYDNFLIGREIKKHKISLFHTPGAILPLGVKNCPYIATIHDLGFKVLPQMGKKTTIAYYNFVFKNTLRKADLIVTDSLSVKNEIREFYQIKSSRIKVIPLGVDRFYLEREKEAYLEKIREDYHLGGQKIIFTNSAHSPRKNVDFLIKIFIKYHHYFKDTCLIISGVINKKFVLKIPDYSKRSNIILLGYIPKRKLRAFYQIANLFIYPSLYEGFGLPLLEAMASKTITLASNISSFREIIPNENWLFDPLKIDDGFEKIKCYLNTSNFEKKRLIRAYGKIVDNFSWQKTAKEMVNIFNSF